MEEDDPNRGGIVANQNTIKLSDLLDFAIQQVFHEITVLSELLPKKLDADKKISLVQFAHATRNLFVKLLALVKWVRSSRKFESCSSISYFLDHQAYQFVETADKLLEIANSLTLARLPYFEVQVAVDVLTNKSFTKLPLCIKENFIKEKKISLKNQALVLKRLNQVVQYRVALEAMSLSSRISELRIRNGHLTMIVPGEFQAQLTILGDRVDMHWTLLNIKMLVEDYEVGYGSTLVHPTQLNALHNIIQSRIEAVKQPLAEVYIILHTLAQSLQLDVLFCQASQLVAGRLKDRIVIEEYDPAKRILTIGYFISRVTNAARTHSHNVPQYRITIYGNAYDEDDLHVKHIPPVPGLGEIDCRPGRISLENLLAESFLVRSRERLMKIRKKIEAVEPKAMLALRGNTIPYLYFPLLRDSVDNELEFAAVSVNTYTGRVHVDIPALSENFQSDVTEMEAALYEFIPTETLRAKMDKIKVSLVIERYRKAIAASPVRIISEAQMTPIFKKMEKVSPQRICLQFAREEHYYLVVSFKANDDLSVTVKLHLVSTADDKLQTMELNQGAFSLLGVTAPLQQVIDLEANTYGEKAFAFDDWFSMRKDARKASTAIRQLAPYIASVDDRLAFLRVCIELEKKSIGYKKIESEPYVGGSVLHITDLSSIISTADRNDGFFNDLKRCCLRLDNRIRGQWPFECCVVNPPVFKDTIRDFDTTFNNGSVCTWVQDMNAGGADIMVSTIVERMLKYNHIYDIVYRFSKAYRAHYHQFCNIVIYTYHKLVIAYGPTRDQLMVVNFQPRNDRDRFKITFGNILPRCGKDPFAIKNHCANWNPHCMMSPLINNKFNRDNNLVELVHYLVKSTTPLYALSQFNRVRFQSNKVIANLLGSEQFFPLKLKHLLVSVNEYIVRLIVADLHLEIVLLEDNQVAVRDCSRNQPRIAGLHQFFNMISGGTSKVCHDNDSGKLKAPSPHGTAQGPPSLPPHLGSGASPAVDLKEMNMNLLSAPPQMDGNSPRSNEGARLGDHDQTSRPLLPVSSEPVIISHQALVKACAFTRHPYDGILHSPLDEYLYGLTLLRRLKVAISCYRRGSIGSGQTKYYTMLLGGADVVRSMETDVDYIKVVIPSMPLAGLSQYTVTFLFRIDPMALVLKLKISFAGDNLPNEQDISMFEQYFERHVLRLNNEIAIMAFMQLCRVVPRTAISSIAQILHMQLEPNPYATWTFMLQLVYVGGDPQHARRYSSAVMMNDQQMLILFIFRKQGSSEKSLVKVLYDASSNTVKQSGTVDENVQATFSAANQEAAQTGGCPLFSGARQLLDRYCSGLMTNTTGPGSIGNVGVGVGSVPPGSNTGPVSVASMGSGSVPPMSAQGFMNPASNT